MNYKSEECNCYTFNFETSRIKSVFSWVETWRDERREWKNEKKCIIDWNENKRGDHFSS